METASPPNPFLKQNGNDLFCGGQQTTNGSLRCFQGDEEEDFGPETDVDAVDDVLSIQTSSIAAAKALVSSKNKEFEDDLERQRNQLSEFDDPAADGDRSTTTPTPPVQDLVGLPEAENVAEAVEDGEDSDGEEWNYFKGEDKTTTSSATQEELEDMESQLNPEAPAFVPEAPLILAHEKFNDHDISSSPKRGAEKSLENVPLPSQNDFHMGIIGCPGEFNRLNEVDSRNSNQIDDKNLTSNRSDESEILSTKAEFGDDTLLSFSNSMNTSTAFSSGIPDEKGVELFINDDDKGSSDVLFTNENDFDPCMNAPKELQDLISSPEPDDNLVPGTPHSTVAEASASPSNFDSSPSHFMEFERGDDVSNNKTFGSNQDCTVEEQNELSEQQKPLTFAEVLKRPSPRTSPEPPLSTSSTPEPSKECISPDVIIEKVVEAIDNEEKEEEKLIKETNLFAQSDEVESIAQEPCFDPEQIKQTLVEHGIENKESNLTVDISIDEEKLDGSQENIREPVEIYGVVNDNIKFDSQIDSHKEELHAFENTPTSPFITVRNSTNSDDLVDFNDLNTADEEKPPQIFEVDDKVQHFDNFNSTIDDIKQVDDLLKTSTSVKSDLTNSNKEIDSEHLKFMPINSEDLMNESSSEFNALSKNEPVTDVAPEDLQFGTIDSKFEFNDLPNSQNQSEFKEEDTNLPSKDLPVKENYFENKSSVTEVKPVLDFNELHFNEEKSEKISTDTEVHNVFNNISFNSDKTNDLVSSNDQFAFPVISSADNITYLCNDTNFSVSQDPNILLKDETLSALKPQDELYHNLPTENVSPVNDEIHINSNPFLNNTNKLSETNTIESSLFQFEPSSNFASENISQKEFEEVTNESVNEALSSSAPVKQLEETLEQTINIDFIPAEPLTAPEISPKDEPEKIVEVAKTEDNLITEAVLPSNGNLSGERIEILNKDIDSSSVTPPPTPAPGLAEEKPEEKEGLLAAAASAAVVAGAAAAVGVVSSKTSIKKSTSGSSVTKKPSPSTATSKKPSDSKTGTKALSPTKTTAIKASPSSAKATAPTLSARKSLTSTTAAAPASKLSAKPAVGTKTSTTTNKLPPVSKSSSIGSKPSTPSSKPTTPTSSSRPSSANKTTPSKPSVTKLGSTTSTKPKLSGSTIGDKKPLTNGDLTKTLKKSEQTAPPKKTVTLITTAKPLSALTKPLPSKTTTSTTSKPVVSSATKAPSTTTASSRLKTSAPKLTSTLNNSTRAKLPTKPADKTVKETVNKQISSTAKVGANKIGSTKTNSSTLKKTDSKTSTNKPSPIKKPTSGAKKVVLEELTQDHIVTTTNGFTEELLIVNELKLEKDSSLIDINNCDDPINASN